MVIDKPREITVCSSHASIERSGRCRVVAEVSNVSPAHLNLLQFSVGNAREVSSGSLLNVAHKIMVGLAGVEPTTR